MPETTNQRHAMTVCVCGEIAAVFATVSLPFRGRPEPWLRAKRFSVQQARFVLFVTNGNNFVTLLAGGSVDRHIVTRACPDKRLPQR